MNDNDIKFDGEQKNTYHATSNLNTAIENPQINMNSVVGVNIKSVDSINPVNDVYSSNLQNNDSLHSFQDNQSFDVTSESGGFQKVNDNLSQTLSADNSFEVAQNNFEANQTNSHFVPTDSSTATSYETSSESGYVATSLNEQQVAYEPTMQEKKKHGVTFKITREFKVMLFIVFILFIFILIVPYIYDFFKELQLVITTG